MFKKILIANRGEIACRIIRSARKLGIATVAVYSDADRNAVHVNQADEAVYIGGSPVGESYLNGGRIIDAALRYGADAIHPGYGFLSENPDFVDAVEHAGLVFIGPSAMAIRAMGLKDSAKRLMQDAGIPVVPGYLGERQDADFMLAEAEKIGFPVLIKARAGGGGKGMRRVDRAQDFCAAFEGAQREAANAFGDPACLIEKYILSPRHIEIQVFGDAYGNIVHLFERDCSLQRRHQKVVEEAPAPGMSEEMRQAMGNTAVRAAQAIGYCGAGTIEFIVDASQDLSPDRFWFMEMNTRLQVEHPVTEEITGLDLVELQLLVADGKPLPFTQADVKIAGHAFEVRLYAENPQNGFLPVTGTLEHLRFSNRARIETGVRQGDIVTQFYDPMIAKIIVCGADRAIALHKLTQALEETQLTGMTTNLAFLHRLVGQEDFVAGNVDTGLIERHFDELIAIETPPRLVPIAAVLYLQNAFVEEDFGQLANFRLYGTASRSVDLFIDAVPYHIEVSVKGNQWILMFDGEADRVTVLEKSPEPLIELGNKRQHLTFASAKNSTTLFLKGRAYVFNMAQPDSNAAGISTSDTIVAPMPGTVMAVNVKAGCQVKVGEALIVMEAMKMEHTLTAPRDGVIAQVMASSAAQVEAGMVLVTLETESE